ATPSKTSIPCHMSISSQPPPPSTCRLNPAAGHHRRNPAVGNHHWTLAAGHLQPPPPTCPLFTFKKKRFCQRASGNPYIRAVSTLESASKEKKAPSARTLALISPASASSRPPRLQLLLA
ncbi:unnamed protein product, partial [Prunus brigantina]